MGGGGQRGQRKKKGYYCSNEQVHCGAFQSWLEAITHVGWNSSTLNSFIPRTTPFQLREPHPSIHIDFEILLKLSHSFHPPSPTPDWALSGTREVERQRSQVTWPSSSRDPSAGGARGGSHEISTRKMWRIAPRTSTPGLNFESEKERSRSRADGQCITGEGGLNQKGGSATTADELIFPAVSPTPQVLLAVSLFPSLFFFSSSSDF